MALTNTKKTKNRQIHPPSQGVDTALWLATAASGPPAESSGGFWFDRKDATMEFGSRWLGGGGNASSAADVNKLWKWVTTSCAPFLKDVDGYNGDQESVGDGGGAPVAVTAAGDEKAKM
jgi:hypothetical protein